MFAHGKPETVQLEFTRKGRESQISIDHQDNNKLTKANRKDRSNSNCMKSMVMLQYFDSFHGRFCVPHMV